MTVEAGTRVTHGAGANAQSSAGSNWDGLSAAYNFHRFQDRRSVLVDLLGDEARRLRTRGLPVIALDIGSGTGISEEAGASQEYLGRVREQVDELWGVEPDPAVTPALGIDRVFQSTLEELDMGGASVNLAYSYLVQEHVDDGRRFLGALYEHLAPGGVYLGLTVNSRHCFARIVRALHYLRLDELVLRTVFRSHDNSYHYAVRYKCNDRDELTRTAEAIGFLRPTFVMLESHDARRYFKGPLRVLYAALQWKRRILRRPDSLCIMIVRLEKPSMHDGTGVSS